MKTQLQELVEALAAKHGFCLGWDDREFVLTLSGQEHHLVIEAMDEVMVKVGHRIEGEPPRDTDPYAVLFYTRVAPWVIVEGQTLEFSFTAATLENRQSGYYCANVFSQAAATQAIAQWTEGLSPQEWLKNGVVVAPASQFDHPPSYARLTTWRKQGGCEALDGCWVEPHGHCEHGHPSWLLHFGMA